MIGAPARKAAGQRIPAKGAGFPGAKPAVAVRELRRFTPRATIFVPAPRNIASVLVDAGRRKAARVYLVGPIGDPTIDGARRFALGDLGPGWDHDERGHYLETGLPVLRYRHRDGQRVEVHRAATWFGTETYTAEHAAAAWRILGELVLRRFGDGAALLSTPATTGRELWRRSIPAGARYVATEPELAQTIRATAGQGRIELCPALDELPELVELDGRLMYAALCRELPGALVEHDHGPWDPYARARYRVAFQVPDGWSHVGILPVRGERGWTWPTSGRHETWCDGAELLVAHRAGWSFEVLERFLFATDRPLDTWSRRLIDLAQIAESGNIGDVDDTVRRLVRAGIRAIALHGLGAFVGRHHVVTRTVPVGAELPPDAIAPRLEGNVIAYGAPAPLPQAELVHPEWPAAVWARCRARMARAALSVPRETVVGFSTDALYLTADPGWTDTGRAGSFRVKGRRVGPIPAPQTRRDLLGALAELEELEHGA